MPTFTDRTSRLLKHTKADKPKMGVGIPDYNDGYEGETRIQMVEGNPRLYLKTNAGKVLRCLRTKSHWLNLPENEEILPPSLNSL